MAGYVEKTISAYDQSPDKYQNTTWDMQLQPEFDRFIEMVRGADTSVLDAGCAYGRDTAAFSKEGLDATGIDLSEELLKRATELNSGLRFKKMDVRKLDFDDSSFDGIWCSAVLLHLKDIDISQALQEFRRVLRSGGALFVTFKKGEGTRQVLETFSSNNERFYNFKTIESATSLLQNNGFKDVDAYYINEREVFGPDKRNLDWVHCFSVKA